MCRAIADSLQRTLDIDVDDPCLDGLVVVDVRSALGGLYVAVLASADVERVAEQQARLDAALPHFRGAMARELARKRVPAVRFVVVPAGAVDL
ncbi:MAG: hypothetical protein Q8O67_11590 [Deltaproteobacteria bacterium]|nr:hypothetical protein [Deltaproteobacteria bacterium]